MKGAIHMIAIILLFQASLRREGIMLSQQKPLQPSEMTEDNGQNVNLDKKAKQPMPERKSLKTLREEKLAQLSKTDVDYHEIENVEDLYRLNQTVIKPTQEQSDHEEDTKGRTIRLIHFIAF